MKLKESNKGRKAKSYYEEKGPGESRAKVAKVMMIEAEFPVAIVRLTGIKGARILYPYSSFT